MTGHSKFSRLFLSVLILGILIPGCDKIEVEAPKSESSIAKSKKEQTEIERVKFENANLMSQQQVDMTTIQDLNKLIADHESNRNEK